MVGPLQAPGGGFDRALAGTDPALATVVSNAATDFGYAVV